MTYIHYSTFYAHYFVCSVFDVLLLFILVRIVRTLHTSLGTFSNDTLYCSGIFLCVCAVLEEV